MKLFKLSMLGLIVLGLSACSTMQKDGDAAGDVPVEDRTAGSTVDGTDSVATDTDSIVTVVDEQDIYIGDELSDPSSPLSNRVVYFEYDSSTVRQEDQATLEAHAAYLADNPNLTVRLEGHTDERGSREYNLALGERRALAVRQLLMLQGASIEQFQVTSFGEERPAEAGADEFAWSQNRRVELIYVGR